jgi:hypothetical protein
MLFGLKRASTNTERTLMTEPLLSSVPQDTQTSHFPAIQRSVTYTGPDTQKTCSHETLSEQAISQCFYFGEIPPLSQKTSQVIKSASTCKTELRQTNK